MIIKQAANVIWRHSSTVIHSYTVAASYVTTIFQNISHR